MEFIQAAWPAIICFFIMLVATVVTFMWSRRLGVDMLTLTKAFIRSLPHWWKMLRDPVYRRRVRTVEKYMGGVYELAKITAAMNTLAKIPDEMLGMAYKAPPDRVPALRQMIQRALTDEFDQVKRTVAPMITSLTDEEIAVLADHLSDEWYSGIVSPATVADFLRKEREIIAASPVMVSGHLQRIPRPDHPPLA